MIYIITGWVIDPLAAMILVFVLYVDTYSMHTYIIWGFLTYRIARCILFQIIIL